MMLKGISPSLKREVALRANSCCEYCLSQLEFSPDPFSTEHIIPLSRGGSNDIDNLAFSCQGCNNRKYNHISGIDSVTNTVVSFFNPRKDSWAKHFQWTTDKTILIGLTPSGRATINKLSLNRKGVVNLRKLLVSLGEHPPSITTSSADLTN